MEPTAEMANWTEQIKKDIAEHDVFIFAKGEKNAAMCGFSQKVMQVFNLLKQDYEVRNIFQDPNIRPALCAFTNWPTTPQVFLRGEFIGGCDIVMEMYENGDLKKKLDELAAS